MVHGISERKNIILSKLRSRILKYILHRYINSNNFTKKENDFKYYGHKILIKHCNTAKEPNNLASAVEPVLKNMKLLPGAEPLKQDKIKTICL